MAGQAADSERLFRQTAAHAPHDATRVGRFNCHVQWSWQQAGPEASNTGVLADFPTMGHYDREEGSAESISSTGQSGRTH